MLRSPIFLILVLLTSVLASPLLFHAPALVLGAVLGPRVRFRPRFGPGLNPLVLVDVGGGDQFPQLALCLALLFVALAPAVVGGVILILEVVLAFVRPGFGLVFVSLKRSRVCLATLAALLGLAN